MRSLPIASAEQFTVSGYNHFTLTIHITASHVHVKPRKENTQTNASTTSGGFYRREAISFFAIR